MKRRNKAWALCLLFAALAAAGTSCGLCRSRTTLSDEALADAKVTTLDDFSGDLSWTAEPDWGDPADVKAAGATPADRVMAVTVKPGPKTKSMVSRALEPPRDLSKHNAVLVDVTSELDADCRIALALITTAEGTFIEAPPVAVRPGPNRNIAFRLDGKDFKSAASKWQHTEPAGDLSAVRKIVLIVVPKSAGAVRIDNVRLAILPAR